MTSCHLKRSLDLYQHATELNIVRSRVVGIMCFQCYTCCEIYHAHRHNSFSAKCQPSVTAMIKLKSTILLRRTTSRVFILRTRPQVLYMLQYWSSVTPFQWRPLNHYYNWETAMYLSFDTLLESTTHSLSMQMSPIWLSAGWVQQGGGGVKRYGLV